MADERDVEQFQLALLETLRQDAPAETLLLRLRADPRAAAFQRYLDGFDPRMVEMAVRLMRRWTRLDMAA